MSAHTSTKVRKRAKFVDPLSRAAVSEMRRIAKAHVVKGEPVKLTQRQAHHVAVRKTKTGGGK